MSKTVVVTPTYNERANIALLVPEVFELLPDLHILVIDDSSPDGTGEEVKRMQSHYPNLDLLSRPGKQGLGRAYLEGFKRILADPAVDRIIMMDADGSHAVQYLPSLLAASDTCDFVIGSRYVPGGGIENWEPWRYALSRYGNYYARALTVLPIKDLTAGFTCFRADLLRKLDLAHFSSSGYAFQMELKFRSVHEAKARVKEIPIIFKERREGESKISRHIIREGLTTPWRLLFERIFSV